MCFAPQFICANKLIGGTVYYYSSCTVLFWSWCPLVVLTDLPTCCSLLSTLNARAEGKKPKTTTRRSAKNKNKVFSRRVITINHLANSFVDLTHPHIPTNISHHTYWPVISCFFAFRRWEAVHMPMARVWMEVRPIGWADASLSKAHGSQTVQVHGLREELCAQRSPGAAHETALTKK